MPRDAVILKSHLVQEAGMHDSIYLEKYEAPVAADGSTDDIHKDYDLWAARRGMALLKANYPGHFWCVESDVRKHLFKISIPILMGIGDWYVINLRTHELTPGTVLAAGGELLERYRLPAKFELGSFLEARAKHSPLANIGKVKIPE